MGPGTLVLRLGRAAVTVSHYPGAIEPTQIIKRQVQPGNINQIWTGNIKVSYLVDSPRVDGSRGFTPWTWFASQTEDRQI